MKKCILFLITLFVFFSCSNEDDNRVKIEPEGATSEFVRLSGNNTQAGILKIVADVPEVGISWVAEGCNLDTTQTTVILENGRGELPVRWVKKLCDGSYAPLNTAFKAWVRIHAGGYSKDVPLVWAERVDSTVLTQNIRTKAHVNPRVSSFSFDPATVVMNANGGKVTAILQNVTTASIQYGQLGDNGVDLTTLPTSITETRDLEFKWVNNTPATNAFTVAVAGVCLEEGIWNYFTVSYMPGGGEDNDIVFDRATLPAGNIPYAGGSYEFFFTATNYTGSVQVNAFDDAGNVLATGTKTTELKSTVVIPANTEVTPRNIVFKYKIDGNDNWLILPNTTNRAQDGNGGGNPGNIVPSEIFPPEDIPEDGGDYYCIFTGGPGKVMLRALKNGVLVETSENLDVNPPASTLASVTIPGLNHEKNSVIKFEFSADGGVTWIPITERKQNNETLSVNLDGPVPTITARNGKVNFKIGGNFSKPVRVYAKYKGEVVGEATAPFAPQDLIVPVSDNTTGAVRNLDFFWTITVGGEVTNAFFGTIKQLGN